MPIRRPAIVEQQPAIARWVGGLEADHDEIGAVVELAAKPNERFGPEQRRIPIKHEHGAGKAGKSAIARPSRHRQFPGARPARTPQAPGLAPAQRPRPPPCPEQPRRKSDRSRRPWPRSAHGRAMARRRAHASPSASSDFILAPLPAARTMARTEFCVMPVSSRQGAPIEQVPCPEASLQRRELNR